jgi:16S rRNA C1402 N4-methylase RsmH
MSFYLSYLMQNSPSHLIPIGTVLHVPFSSEEDKIIKKAFSAAVINFDEIVTELQRLEISVKFLTQIDSYHIEQKRI